MDAENAEFTAMPDTAAPCSESTADVALGVSPADAAVNGTGVAAPGRENEVAHRPVVPIVEPGAAPGTREALPGLCPHCGQAHPGGRFVSGCPGPRLSHGEHSKLVRSGQATGTQAVVAAARTQLRREVDATGIVKGSLADSFIELDAVRTYLGGRLETEGPLTNKGRTRALLNAYLSVIDRQVRLASLLGLEPRAKTVDFARALSGLEEEQGE